MIILSSESLPMISVGLEGNSIALLWHSVHCDLPLAPWVMKGLINESIRVSVCCSLCVSGMQSGPDVPSLRARRGKGCHCWQAWWMAGTLRRDKDECDSPRPAKGGRRWTTEGRSRDADHLPFLVASPAGWAQSGGRTRGWKEEEDEYGITLLRDRPPLSPLTLEGKKLTSSCLNWEQYLIKALDKITGLNKHTGIHQ